MADMTYNVKVRYDLDKAGAESAAAGLAHTFDRLASAVAGAFAADKVLGFAKKLVDLQSQAEGMQIALATMMTGFGAPGFQKGAESFRDSMTASAELMKQIRKDAATLPGTAEDLMTVMRAAMPGGINAGKAIMGQGSILDMSKRLMASANLLQIPGGANTVAREFQAMMEGRAMTRNDLFARLRGLMGDKPGSSIGAKEFNALTESQRWDKVDSAMKKLVDPALPSYAGTWRAISTTTENWAQQLARVGSSAWHESLKSHLKDINTWLQTNQASVESLLRSMGESFGESFGRAFDAMKSALGFLVSNRSAILTVAEALGALLIGGKMAGGFGKGGVGNALGGAGLGVALNGLTGGSGLSGAFMGLAGALLSFGGAVGVASAAALAFGAAANMVATAIDDEQKFNINKHVEGMRLMPLYKQFETSEGGMSDMMLSVGQQIIKENRLSTPDGLDKARFAAYFANKTDLSTEDGSSESARRFLTAVSRYWRDTTYAGPNLPTEAEKIAAKMYDKGTPRPAEVNLTINIRQDISQAEDPDRILVRTRQAIEDAMIRPIESGNNRFSVLR